MKLFLILLGMAAAGILGYKKEPELRFALTGISPTDGKMKIANPLDSAATAAPAIDPASLSADQLPEKVTISVDIKFSDETSGLIMTIAAGSKVKLVRIDGANAVVRPGDTPYSIILPIEKTDLMAQLAAKPPITVTPTETEPAPTAEPALAPESDPTQESSPVAEPAPTPTGDSEEPAPMQEPVVEPQAMPEPALTTEPTPETTPAPEPAAATGSTDVVQVMQESIRNAQVKEFTFDQVLGWEAGANETVDGESFQTGNVSYKAETIFGVKTIQAKALIKHGKVNRWIWPKSGMEIK